jgi:hypothetical protein
MIPTSTSRTSCAASLTSVLPWTILGECERESHFDLVCWNEADDRATIGAEIEARLDAFRASAPWPIPAGD